MSEQQEILATELLCRMTEEVMPASILIVGDLAASSLAPWLTAHPDCTANVFDLNVTALPATTLRADWAVVAGPFDTLPADQVAQLLGRLRDITVPRFTVATPVCAPPGWTRPELAGFALDHLGDYALDTDPALLSIYRYDIHTYKRTPEWLNPDFWANPARWDKDWW